MKNIVLFFLVLLFLFCSFTSAFSLTCDTSQYGLSYACPQLLKDHGQACFASGYPWLTNASPCVLPSGCRIIPTNYYGQEVPSPSPNEGLQCDPPGDYCSAFTQGLTSSPPESRQLRCYRPPGFSVTWFTKYVSEEYLNCGVRGIIMFWEEISTYTGGRDPDDGCLGYVGNEQCAPSAGDTSVSACQRSYDISTGCACEAVCVNTCLIPSSGVDTCSCACPSGATFINGICVHDATGLPCDEIQCQSDSSNNTAPTCKPANPVCSQMISEFKGSNTSIDPIAGGSIIISANIASAKPISWTLTLAGQTFNGSDNPVSVTWDGKDSSGKVIKEGSYTATLTVDNGDCSESADLQITVKPGGDSGDDPCKLYVQFGSSAHVASGNLTHSQTLFTIPNSKMLGDFTLSYDSLDGYNGPLGIGWTHTYDISLSDTGNNTFSVMEGSGKKVLLFYNYSDNSNNAYYTPETSSWPVLAKQADGTYQLSQKDGSKYIFTPAGKITSLMDRNSNALSFSYDTNNNLIVITDPYGRGISISYGADNKIATVTDPYGNITVFTYAGNTLTGVFTQTTAGPLSWVYTYDASAFMLTKTDPRGNTTSYTYDSQHRVSTSTDPVGMNKTMNYPAALSGDLGTTTVVEKDGGVWTYEYDTALGVLTAKTDPQANSITYTYDDNKNPISETHPDGGTVSYTYDDDRNVMSVTDPMGNVTSYTYNEFGQIMSTTDPLGNVTAFYYDDLGNLLTATDPMGNAASITYDTHGNALTVTDARGKSTNYAYDSMGRVTTITDAIGGVTGYTYNAYDRIATVTDANNHTISYDYDSSGRVIKMTDQLGHMETYTYDLFGDILTSTDRKGQLTTYTYDSMGRLKNAAFGDGSSTTYTYDDLGRLTTISDSVSGAITYQYALAGCPSCGGGVSNKVVQETTPLGSISYTYDALGRRASMTVAGRPTVNYNYDAAGRLAGINAPISGSSGHFSLGHDPDGRRSNITLPNGTKTTYTYDETSRVQNLQHLDPLNKVLESIGYTYDANGNRTSMDRLLGNPPDVGSALDMLFNSANQMLTFNSMNITYDANGSMASRTESCGTTNYTWDARNRLVGITGYNTGCASLSATFKYDAIGRRIEKTINGTTTKYLYDGLNIVQELQNAAPSVNYIRTSNIDEPLARIEASGVVRYYQYDALGSVIGMTDENGQMMTIYAYDAFGKVSISGEISDNQFQYTGRENDGTGLYYYRARYYSPEMQRFISEDPIGLAGGINRFAYAGNNPVNFVDPLGLFWSTGYGVEGSWIPGFGLKGGLSHMDFWAQRESADYYYSSLTDNTLTKPIARGFDLGLSAFGALAYNKKSCGKGSWEGNFDEATLSLFGLTFSYFWGPEGINPFGEGWHGITWGVGFGLPGFSYAPTDTTRMDHKPLFGF